MSFVSAYQENKYSSLIGMVYRKLTEDESIGFSLFLIGYDGLGIILNEAVPLDSISKKQVIDIFSGRIFNLIKAGKFQS